MEITTDEIREDIVIFQDRIIRAKQKLSNLPDGILPYKEHQKREKKRKDLISDIKHFELVIKYAAEALAEENEHGKPDDS